MRYLCLVYVDERLLSNLPPAARAELEAECRDYCERLQASGQLVIGEVLQPLFCATTLRPQGDGFSLRDGPLLDNPEQPAAFYLFEARDLNDAILLASHIPPVKLGCAEVRAVRPRAPP